LLWTLALFGIGLVIYLVRRSLQSDAIPEITALPSTQRRSRSRSLLLATAGVFVVVAIGIASYLLLTALPAQGTNSPDSRDFAKPVVTPQAVLTAIAGVLTPTSHAGNRSGPTDPEAYLQDALDFIQTNSIMPIDWKAWRAEVLAEAGKPLTRADAHLAIVNALKMLGDNHSQLWPPDVFLRSEQSYFDGLMTTPLYPERSLYLPGGFDCPLPGLSICSAGLRTGDVIEAIDGQPTTSMGASTFFQDLYGGSYVGLTLKREKVATPITVTLNHPYLSPYLVPEGRRLQGNIGYVRLPGNIDLQLYDEYAEVVQETIRDLDQPPACGWVVDLQDNTGGYPFPMISGIGPVLGGGDAMKFVDKRGNRFALSYDAPSGLLFVGSSERWIVSHPFLYQLKRPMPPVAVLTDKWTASAGEMVLVSFRGRPNTRTFGEPTFGIPTYNAGRVLDDWAYLIVTTGYDADRTGKVYGYNERIQPDQFVASGSPDQQGTDADPVLAAGVKWLREQPACAR
jgi:C-terminal processing protease CtpA/Prc